MASTMQENIYLEYIRHIRKVRKRRHQYPEFGHTQGEIQKKLQKSKLAFKGGGGGGGVG
jgi:hypothetical protein